VDTEAAARRWADTWRRAWPEKDADAIVALYADSASYRALAFREPDLGLTGVRSYLDRNFAVEWWGRWIEDGTPLTLAGATVLRFDDAGQVIDHRDYWNELERREPPYAGWAEG
jgi:ketosteroid isomerase-like protein